MEQKEGLFNEESFFDKMLEEKAKAGWQYIGTEKLTETEFVEGAKFEEITKQDEKKIKDRYSQGGKYEVDLVLDMNTQKIQDMKKILTKEEFDKVVADLADRDKNYLVFRRVKNKK